MPILISKIPQKLRHPHFEALTFDSRFQFDNLVPVYIESIFDIFEKIDVFLFGFAGVTELLKIFELHE